jgi:dTDP-4-dehydrorhamnose 3,5-epimerase-like enzyme
MKMSTGNIECTVIELPKISDVRGSLSFIESFHHIPFEIKRVFYLYDVPGGAIRAGHALKTCEQFLIALSGSFEVVIDDGVSRCEYLLNRAYKGLLIPPQYWRELKNFSSGSVCLVLASQPYDEGDYFSDYEEFVSVVQGNRA